MADYIIHGKKGNGKSLVTVGRMRDALLERRVVATNLNLYVEHMFPKGLRDFRCYRLPDRPTIDDLLMIGRGSDQIDESSYGIIGLDECASMLNSRTFSDKGRGPFLDWFVHSRKLGWDSYFICQNPVQIDKQVRESLVELSVSCKRMDRLRVPFIGGLTKILLGFEIRPPKIHVATVRYGTGHEAMISDRWIYRGTELYSGYDTRQVFRENYSDGVYMLLSPWHLSAKLVPPAKGFVGPMRAGTWDWEVTPRYTEKKMGENKLKYIGVVLLIGVVIGVFGHKFFAKPKQFASSAVGSPAAVGALPVVPVSKYSQTITAVGLLRSGGAVSILLSDGRTVVPLSFMSAGSGWEAEIESGVWVKGVSQ